MFQCEVSTFRSVSRLNGSISMTLLYPICWIPWEHKDPLTLIPFPGLSYSAATADFLLLFFNVLCFHVTLGLSCDLYLIKQDSN